MVLDNNMESRRGKRRGKRKAINNNNSYIQTRAALGKLEKLLICTLCDKQLKDPCVIGSCEHVFCKSCVQAYKGKHCPKCKIPVANKDMQNETLISNVVNYANDMRSTMMGKQPKGSSNGPNLSESDEEVIITPPAATKSPISRRQRDLNNSKTSSSSSSIKNDTNVATSNNELLAVGSTPTSSSSTRSKRRALRPSVGVSKQVTAAIADSRSPGGVANPPGVVGGGLRLKRNIKGETPLHLAAIKGDVVSIRRLLHQGANPNEKDNAGWTPLHEACHHGHAKIAEILLDSGAFIDVPACDNETPLHDAVGMEKAEIVVLLVSRGANKNVRNSRGLIPGDMSKSEEMKVALNTPKLSAIDSPQSTNSTIKSLNPSQNENIILLATGLNEIQLKNLDDCAAILNAVVVVDFYEDVTHVIADCDDEGHCQRTVKFMLALLTGKWILNYTWVEECLAFKRKLYEEPFEVSGNKRQQSTFGAKRSRFNVFNQCPPLFDGCSFYFHGSFVAPSPNRETLTMLVKQGGGVLLNREPRPQHLLGGMAATIATAIPYHAPRDIGGGLTLSSSSGANQFVIYQELLPAKLKSIQDGSIRCETFSWLLNCISAFELLPPSMNKHS